MGAKLIKKSDGSKFHRIFIHKKILPSKKERLFRFERTAFSHRKNGFFDSKERLFLNGKFDNKN